MHQFHRLHLAKPCRDSRIKRAAWKRVAIEVYLIASRFVASSCIAENFVAEKIIHFYGNVGHSV